VLGFDVACFGPATRIRTLRGEIQVESLRPGEDQAITAAGTAVPIVWIGQRHLDLARHPLPQDVMPVRVRRGAIAPGQPARDLLLSPDHALALGGVLIPVRYLVNGRTIRQEPARAITYWHVELARHDVLLAEGLPCESYLDTGNRAAFANARPALALHPDFARPAAAPHACAPLVLSGPRRTEARRALLARAEAIGHRLTANPALRVLIDGAPARATLTDGRCTIQLPPAARRLRLLSRSWVPAHTHAEDDDMRRLGIAVTRLRLDDRPLALDDPRLSSGWQKPEGGLRWTDGDAGMALAGGRRLVFEVAMHGTYWATDDPVRWPIFACAQ
jgi:hypothetical protein